MEPVTITKELEVAAGSSGYLTLYTVPGGKTFRLKKTTVHFNDDCDYNLSLAIFFGVMKMVPTSGFLVGDNETIESSIEVVYPPDTDVKLYYSNTGSSTVHATVTLEGELE